MSVFMCMCVIILFVPRVVAHCRVTCVSCGGKKKQSQSREQLKLRPTSKCGDFLNPGTVLIIALSTVVNYIKRCDLMHARSINNFFLSMTNTRYACLSAPDPDETETLSSFFEFCSFVTLASITF